MRLSLITICFLLFLSCNTSKNIASIEETEKTVSLVVSDLEMEMNNDWFSITAKNKVIEKNLIEANGDKLLLQVIEGYSNQTGDYNISENSEDADVTITIKKIRINHPRFTLNFVKPGPLYKMTVFAEIDSKQKGNYVIEKSSLVNMAEVNYPDKNFKWLNNTEKSDIDNQMATFNAGLRKLYQSLYFDTFEISLRL